MVEQRLAACVNVLPKIRSVYRWSGAVTADDESLLVIKTTAEAFAAVTYQELLALPEFEYTVEETTEGRGSARIEMSACDGAVSQSMAFAASIQNPSGSDFHPA